MMPESAPRPESRGGRPSLLADEDLRRRARSLSPPARAAWSATKVITGSEDLIVRIVPETELSALPAFLETLHPRAFWAIVREPGNLSLTSPAHPGHATSSLDAPSGRMRVLTFEAPLPLDLCGYLAPLATWFAEREVPILPQCGFTSDHVLIPSERLDEATRLVERWIRACRDVDAEEDSRPGEHTQERASRTTCMNCSAPREGRFCSACGQDHRYERLSVRDGLVDALDTALFLNGKVPRTIRALTLRPGRMVREYVAGKRVPYVTPLKYAFYSAALWFLFVAMVNAGQGGLAEFVVQWGQLFNLLIIPVLAVTIWLVMWGAGYTLAEQLCFALFVFGHLFLVRGLLIATLLYERGWALQVARIDQFGFPLYFSWALIAFHRGRLRFLFLRLLGALAGVILVSHGFTALMHWLATR